MENARGILQNGELNGRRLASVQKRCKRLANGLRPRQAQQANGRNPRFNRRGRIDERARLLQEGLNHGLGVAVQERPERAAGPLESATHGQDDTHQYVGGRTRFLQPIQEPTRLLYVALRAHDKGQFLEPCLTGRRTEKARLRTDR